jgi:hypothetical protein
LRAAAQTCQRQVHRLQRLPQVMVAGRQEPFLGALRTVGLLHQPDHFGGQLAVLRGLRLASGLQHVLPASHCGEQRREFSQSGRMVRGRFRLHQRGKA